MQPLCEESSMLIFQAPKCPQGILVQSLPVMYYPGFVMMYYYHYSEEKSVKSFPFIKIKELPHIHTRNM